MSRKLLQDMVVGRHPQKRSVHRAPMPKVVKDDSTKQELYEAQEQKEVKQVKESWKEEKGDKNKYTLWFVAAISIIFFLFALSSLFSRATVTINPKIEKIIVDKDLSASKDASPQELSFDLVVISGEESQSVHSLEKKSISQRATGRVKIFNNYSSSNQRLDIDTRLEGSNGKLYKTENGVVVPGRSEDGTPGSVEVGIYATEVGEEYNSEPLDFRIVGFKGTSKYSKFDVKSVTDGKISGGMQGEFFVVSDEQKQATIDTLKTILEAKLSKKASDQTPDGFILFENAAFLEIDDSAIDAFSTENTFSIKVKGTLYGFLLSEEKLAQKIAEESGDLSDEGEVYLQSIRELTFFLSGGESGLLSDGSISYGDVQRINFTLSGDTDMVWKLDAEGLTQSLLGKSKKEFNQILSQNSNIDSAELVISPFWRRSISDDPKKLKVIVNYPE
jgi:hypothetical protein